MFARVVILTLCMIAGTAYISVASKPAQVPARSRLSGLPFQVGSYEGRDEPEIEDRIMAVLGVDDYLKRTYRDSDRGYIGLYVGYYESQSQGDSIHSPLNCLPGAGWNPVKRERMIIEVQEDRYDRNRGPRRIEVNVITIAKGLDRQVVIYWYQSQGRVIASEYWGKFYTVVDAIRTRRSDAALVRIISPVLGMEDDAESAARTKAVEFTRMLFPMLHRYLPD